MDLLYDKRSISSEANSDAVFSNEAHEIFARQQQNQVLWQPQEIEETLFTVPNGVHILEMVKSGCFLGKMGTKQQDVFYNCLLHSLQS